MTSVSLCPGCGTPLAPDARFCVRCGHHAPEHPPAEPPRKAPKPRFANARLESGMGVRIVPPPTPPPTPHEHEWFYGRGGETVGPVPEADLKRLLDSGALTADTPVWSPGMQGWTRAWASRLAPTKPHVCPRCGGALGASARFCIVCGTPVPASAS